MDSRSRPYTAEEDALIGCLPDEEVARRLNRSVAAIVVRRSMLGREKPGTTRRPWKAAEIALLGRHPDAELAVRFNRTEEAVSVKRGKLGIPVAERSKAVGI